jgi:hypothetical protein
MAEIITHKEDEITIQVTLKLSGSLMEMENSILDACNEVGCLATEEALQKFDADGSPILVGNIKMTSKGKNNQTYQTPYGSVLTKRYTYQTSRRNLLSVRRKSADYPWRDPEVCPANIAQILEHECACGA